MRVCMILTTPTLMLLRFAFPLCAVMTITLTIILGGVNTITPTGFGWIFLYRSLAIVANPSATPERCPSSTPETAPTRLISWLSFRLSQDCSKFIDAAMQFLSVKRDYGEDSMLELTQSCQATLREIPQLPAIGSAPTSARPCLAADDTRP